MMFWSSSWSWAAVTLPVALFCNVEFVVGMGVVRVVFLDLLAAVIKVYALRLKALVDVEAEVSDDQGSVPVSKTDFVEVPSSKTSCLVQLSPKSGAKSYL